MISKKILSLIENACLFCEHAVVRRGSAEPELTKIPQLFRKQVNGDSIHTTELLKQSFKPRSFSAVSIGK